MVEFKGFADYAHVHMKSKKWHIFCKVVDNFGDIGVCWRLAKQLHNEYDLSVRLYVDHLDVARRIIGDIENVAAQDVDGISVVRWDDNTRFEAVADIVIETFACGLPAAYIAEMQPYTVWVNVDYLSAEPWVAEFHALNGKHADTKLIRHFYFPGFHENTGGLFREQDLIVRRDAFQQSKAMQQAYWQKLAVVDHDNNLKISLFSYNNAPIEALLDTLVSHEQPVTLFLPYNTAIPEQLLGNTGLLPGDCLKAGQLTMQILPFLSQGDYDKLLWACDLNFVRGEDSWSRALWAGKPFIWQPYLQEDNAHLVKLKAFLMTFYGDHETYKIIDDFHRQWSIGEFSDAVWQRYINAFPDIRQLVSKQSELLIQQQALAPKLIAFCDKLAK